MITNNPVSIASLSASDIRANLEKARNFRAFSGGAPLAFS
jgi:hypothetical protein